MEISFHAWGGIQGGSFEQSASLILLQYNRRGTLFRGGYRELVFILSKKAKRIVISTNGYLTERILGVASEHKNIGVRISIEGFPAANDELRGIKDGFGHGLRTLLELQRDSQPIYLKKFGMSLKDRYPKKQ